jgi:quercetin dioxygenase-like cupin family protein
MTTLVKTDKLEVIRLVLPADKEIPHHQVTGEITVQCLEGSVSFIAQGQTKVLEAGQLLFLSGSELHALKGVEDSSVLVTILLEKKASG